MGKKNKEAPEEIYLEEHRAMICLPETVVEAVIECKIFCDGELKSVRKILNQADIREAFHKADIGYIDDEDTFVLTDKGKAYLEEMRLNGEI